MPSILAGIGSAMRQRMISLLEQGGTPVYDPSGKLAIGVMFNGKYTGRPRNTGDQGGGDDERSQRLQQPLLSINNPPLPPQQPSLHGLSWTLLHPWRQSCGHIYRRSG